MQEWLTNAINEEAKLKDLDELEIVVQLMRAIDENNLKYLFITKERLLHNIRVFSESPERFFEIVIDVTRAFGLSVAFFGGNREWYFNGEQCGIEILTKTLLQLAQNLR